VSRGRHAATRPGMRPGRRFAGWGRLLSARGPILPPALPLTLAVIVIFSLPSPVAAGSGAPPTRTVASTAAPATTGSPLGGEAGEGADLARRLLDEQLKALDLTALDELLAQPQEAWQSYLPQWGIKDIVGLFTGRTPVPSPAAILSGLGRLLFAEVRANTGLLLRLLFLAVLCGLLGNLERAFEGGVGRVARTLCYLVLISLAAGTFALAVGAARETVNRLVEFMVALLPLLVGLLAATGAFSLAGMLHPLLLAATHGIGIVVADVVLPLIMFAVVLDIVSGLGGGFEVTGLAQLFRQASGGVLGLCMAVFLGLVALVGAAGAVADSMTLRAAKFLSSTFVPVVGKMFADAAELVAGSSLLLKDAIGLAGVVGVFFLAVLPLVKIVALAVTYRLAGALAQPVDAGGIHRVLHAMGGGLVLVALAAGTVGLMLFLAITAVLVAGNASVMLR